MRIFPPLIATVKLVALVLLFSIAVELLPQYGLRLGITGLVLVMAIGLEEIWQSVK